MKDAVTRETLKRWDLTETRGRWRHQRHQENVAFNPIDAENIGATVSANLGVAPMHTLQSMMTARTTLHRPRISHENCAESTDVVGDGDGA